MLCLKQGSITAQESLKEIKKKTVFKKYKLSLNDCRVATLIRPFN